MSVDDAIALLQRVTSADEHSFWPDDIFLTDPQLFDHTNILGPKQLTDIYLLALAVENGGRPRHSSCRRARGRTAARRRHMT